MDIQPPSCFTLRSDGFSTSQAPVLPLRSGKWVSISISLPGLDGTDEDERGTGVSTKPLRGLLGGLQLLRQIMGACMPISHLRSAFLLQYVVVPTFLFPFILQLLPLNRNYRCCILSATNVTRFATTWGQNVPDGRESRPGALSSCTSCQPLATAVVNLLLLHVQHVSPPRVPSAPFHL